MLLEDINQQYFSIPSFLHNQNDTRRIFRSHYEKGKGIEDIKGMLDQVSKILSFLLTDLENIYKLNGIDYKINHLHYILFRLLTPFELIHEQSITVEGNRGQSSEGLGFYMESKQQKTRSRTEKTNLSKFEDKKKVKQGSCNNNFASKLQDEQFIYKKRLYRKEITKPILNPELECQLVQWVIKKINENKRIRRKDIGKKAREISGNQEGFFASSGWVNRFMHRHPYLKEILTKHAKGNIGRRSSDFNGNSDDQENQIQRLNHDGNFGYQLASQQQSDNDCQLIQQEYMETNYNKKICQTFKKQPKYENPYTKPMTSNLERKYCIKMEQNLKLQD